MEEINLKNSSFRNNITYNSSPTNTYLSNEEYSAENKSNQYKKSNNASLIASSLACLSLIGASLLLSKKGHLKKTALAQYVESPWYSEYKNLCKKFNVKVREVGITGGAADHYQELVLRNNDPEKYQKYLKQRAIRSLDNEKARILEDFDKLNKG